MKARGYPVAEEEVELATVSHGHWDHCAVDRLKGNPVKVQTTGEFEAEGFKISGFPTYHDKSKGKERGLNIILKSKSKALPYYTWETWVIS